MLWTRPDIAYVLGVLSKFVNRLAWLHLAALKRVLRYLTGSVSYCITYTRSLLLRNIAY